MPDPIIGIPDRKHFGDPLSSIAVGQLLDWVAQEHAARRAGLHTDARLGSPELGLYSWAVRKGLPTPGKKHLAVQQPLHEHVYKDFEGTIEKGYGAGNVKKVDSGKVLVTKVTPNSIHFTTASKRFPERFVLSQSKGKQWLLINTTPTEAVPHEKIHYTKISPDKAEAILDNLQPGSSVQAKIDGAASLTKLFKDKVEVLSYRTAKNTGYPIVHTERIFHGRPEVNIPKEYQGSVLRGELYGVADNKAIRPQRLGGLLNATIERSIREQKEKGEELKNLVFDVENVGNKRVTLDMPYEERKALVDRILSTLPSDKFHAPEEAKTPEQAKQLLHNILSGHHPLTEEGIVIHPPTGKPIKSKFTDEHDVYIREFFPGKGKYTNLGVGGFRYSYEPEGPVLGEVGTGLTDDLRKDMFSSPDTYLGRVARVHAQEKFPSGALRAPALLGLHEDYPTSIEPVKEAAIHYVPRSALPLVKKKGLVSGEKLLEDDELLTAAAQGRGTTKEEFSQGVRDILSGWKPDSAKGVNILFRPAPSSVNLAAKHPSKIHDLAPIEIDLDKLLADLPDTRIHGQELMPYEEYLNKWTPEQLEREEDDPSLRHHDLSIDELSKLRRQKAKTLWKHYSDPEGRGMYAPNVPHAAIITPTGYIDPKYLRLPKQANYYHGSPNKLEELEPRSTRVLNEEPAVFATPHRGVALSFTAPWRDDDFEQGKINGQFYMREKYPQALEKIFKGRKGYLHSLSAEGFSTDPRLTTFEAISKNKVKPVSVEEIDDALAALMNSDLPLYRYGEKLPGEEEEMPIKQANFATAFGRNLLNAARSIPSRIPRPYFGPTAARAASSAVARPSSAWLGRTLMPSAPRYPTPQTWRQHWVTNPIRELMGVEPGQSLIPATSGQARARLAHFAFAPWTGPWLQRMGRPGRVLAGAHGLANTALLAGNVGTAAYAAANAPVTSIDNAFLAQ